MKSSKFTPALTPGESEKLVTESHGHPLGSIQRNCVRIFRKPLRIRNQSRRSRPGLRNLGLSRRNLFLEMPERAELLVAALQAFLH